MSAMITNDNPGFTSYRVGVAAEAIAAAVLAQAGYDISVQYGANQPVYDLVAVKPDRVLQISVKGSKVGGWGLTQNYKKGRTYQDAAAEWLKRHGSELVFVFVEYFDVAIGSMPHIYVARAGEVAAHLANARRGRGDTTLMEKAAWKRGSLKGHTETIPDSWKFTQARIDSV